MLQLTIAELGDPVPEASSGATTSSSLPLSTGSVGPIPADEPARDAGSRRLMVSSACSAGCSGVSGCSASRSGILKPGKAAISADVANLSGLLLN